VCAVYPYRQACIAPSQIEASTAFMILRGRLREIVIVFISMELIGRYYANIYFKRINYYSKPALTCVYRVSGN